MTPSSLRRACLLGIGGVVLSVSARVGSSSLVDEERTLLAADIVSKVALQSQWYMSVRLLSAREIVDSEKVFFGTSSQRRIIGWRRHVIELNSERIYSGTRSK